MPRTAKSKSAQTPPTRTTSTKPKTPKAPVLKKAEIEAMLLSAQKKLHDAEVTLDAQTDELHQLRAKVATLDTELTETRDMYYGGQVDISLARHQRDQAQADARTAIAEMRHLTQLLAEAERRANEATEAQTQTSQSELDATQQAAEAQKQISDLKARLTTAEAEAKEVETLRKRVSEQDQQLEARKREMADLTALLADAETRANDTENLREHVAEQDQKLEACEREKADLTALLADAETRANDTENLREHVAEQDQKLEAQRREIEDLTALLEQNEARQHVELLNHALLTDYGRAAVAALITPPDTMRLDQERLDRAAQTLNESNVFDANWYTAAYADIAESGVDPALHYLEFGFAEGRNPRPME